MQRSEEEAMKHRNWIANRLLNFYERVAMRRVPDWVWRREHEAMVCDCEHSQWGQGLDCERDLDRAWDFG